AGTEAVGRLAVHRTLPPHGAPLARVGDLSGLEGQRCVPATPVERALRRRLGADRHASDPQQRREHAAPALPSARVADADARVRAHSPDRRGGDVVSVEAQARVTIDAEVAWALMRTHRPVAVWIALG